MKIHLIGSKDIIIGFELIGIKGTVFEGKDETIDLIQKLIKSEDFVLLIIENFIYDQLEDFLDDIRIKNLNVIIVKIPGLNEEFPKFDPNKIYRQIFG
ncbi:MAG: V-type ATP synthase subunit F [Candidatus Helarchaeota archaeon]